VNKAGKKDDEEEKKEESVQEIETVDEAT